MRLASFLLAAAALQAGVHFEPNRGQAGDAYAFVARGSGASAAIAPQRIDLVTRAAQRTSITIEGASTKARATGLDRLAGVVHYVRGRDARRWVQGVPRFARAKFEDVYPGVDLVYRDAAGDIEFDFELEAGADASRIRLRFSEDPRIDASGGLSMGATRLHAPVAWQVVDGVRMVVTVAFTRLDSNRVGFRLGPYDMQRPLTIDPVIGFATYLGGSDNEGNTQLALGDDGAIFIAGTTYSADFPADMPPDSLLNRPASMFAPDVFVSRLRKDGRTLDWSLFLGGNGFEAASGLRVDGAGNVYLLGITESPFFPVTAGAFRQRIHSWVDAFAMKLDGASGRVLASTFLGVPGVQDPANARLAVDRAGEVYVAGGGSPYYYGDFETTAGAYLSQVQSGEAFGFAMRLNTSLSSRVYATFLKGPASDDIEVDSAGNLIFKDPFTLNKLNAAGTALLFSNYWRGRDIEIGPDGAIHVVGYTNLADFPDVNPLSIGRTPGRANAWRVYLAKLAPSGSPVIQATLFMSPEFVETDFAPNRSLKIALQPGGSPCILNVGSSKLVQTGGLVGAYAGEPDFGGSLVCINDAGTAIAHKTLLPKSAGYNAMKVAPDGAVIMAGVTDGGLGTTIDSFQPRYGGGVRRGDLFRPEIYGDAFVMRVELRNPLPSITGVFPGRIVLETRNYGTRDFQVRGAGFADGMEITWNGRPATYRFVNSGWVRLTVDYREVLPGTNRVRFFTGGPGGGSAEGEVVGVYPVPRQVQVRPQTVVKGSAATRVVVSAANLSRSSILYWNGQPRPATFIPSPILNPTSGSVEIVVQAAEMAQAGSVQVAVGNPSPGGGVTEAVDFAVLETASDVQVPVVLNSWWGLDNPSGFSPRVYLGGFGFGASTQIYWDGKQIPASLSGSGMLVEPPAEDLKRWGAHDVYASNGELKSATVRVFIGRYIYTKFAVADQTLNRLYLVVSRIGPDFILDLVTIDLKTGEILGTVPGVAVRASAIALSTDGRYLYVGDLDGYAKVRRIRTETMTQDLEWAIPKTEPDRPVGLVPVAGQPETLVVWTELGGAAIYDAGRIRPKLPAEWGFRISDRPVFATRSRIYLNEPETGCWQWMEFNADGISGGSRDCSGVVPEDVVRDGDLTYLTDGERVHPVSLPEHYDAPKPQSIAADLARRRVFVNTYYGVMEVDLDTGRQRTVGSIGNLVWADKLLAIDGGALFISGAWIAPVP